MESRSQCYLTASHGRSRVGKYFGWLRNSKYLSWKKKLPDFLTKHVEYYCGIKKKNNQRKQEIIHKMFDVTEK